MLMDEKIALKWKLLAATLEQFEGTKKQAVLLYLPLQWKLNLFDARLWENKDRGSN